MAIRTRVGRWGGSPLGWVAGWVAWLAFPPFPSKGWVGGPRPTQADRQTHRQTSRQTGRPHPTQEVHAPRDQNTPLGTLVLIYGNFSFVTALSKPNKSALCHARVHFLRLGFAWCILAPT